MSSEQTAIRVIHAERDFSVLDKPAGIAVHRGAGVHGRTLVDWLVRRYPEIKMVGDDPKERPGIVHRLDKDTSGVMVVARTQHAFEELKRLFQERRVEKTYLALVAGAPQRSSGMIDAPIGRSPRDPRRRRVGEGMRGTRTAVTRWRVLERFAGYSLLEVKPETGRMHQIRVHFASIGLPIAGDAVYGGSRAALPGLRRQFLHALRIEFSYPPGKRWRLETPLPEDLQSLLGELRERKKYARRTR